SLLLIDYPSASSHTGRGLHLVRPSKGNPPFREGPRPVWPGPSSTPRHPEHRRRRPADDVFLSGVCECPWQDAPQSLGPRAGSWDSDNRNLLSPQQHADHAELAQTESKYQRYDVPIKLSSIHSSPCAI